MRRVDPVSVSGVVFVFAVALLAVLASIDGEDREAPPSRGLSGSGVSGGQTLQAYQYRWSRPSVWMAKGTQLYRGVEESQRRPWAVVVDVNEPTGDPYLKGRELAVLLEFPDGSLRWRDVRLVTSDPALWIRQSDY